MLLHVLSRRYWSIRVGALSGGLLAMLPMLAAAAVMGIEPVFTLQVPLDPGSGSDVAATSIQRFQSGSAGHVVAVCRIGGVRVTPDNDHVLVLRAPDGELRILLREGDVFPAFDGQTLLVTAIHEAWVDRFGSVATRVSLTHPDKGRLLGILRWTTTHWDVVAYERQDVGGETLRELNSLWLTSDGHLRFLGTAKGNHPSTAFYSDRPGPDSVVLGAKIPSYAGLPENTWFGAFSGPAAYNQSGQIFCKASIYAPSGALDGSSPVGGGLWYYDGGRVVQVLPTNADAPDTTTPATVSDTFGLWLADDGWMVFEALLKGPGVVAGSERVLYAAFGDSVRLVARNGALAPGTEGADFGYPFVIDGVISRGRFLFENSVTLASGERIPSLFLWNNGELRLLAQVGRPAAASDDRPIRGFRWNGISPAGRVIFTTGYGSRPGAFTESSIWVVDGDAPPQRLLSDGDPMPLPDGTAGTIRSVAMIDTNGTTGNERFDDRGRFLTGLAPEETGLTTLVWVDPDALLPTPAGTISGTVYQDTDGNGGFSAPDLGLGGVLIQLYYDDGSGGPFGERLRSTETTSDGRYSFTGLDPGDYVVFQAHLPGYEPVSNDRLRVRLTAATFSPGNDFLDHFPVPRATLTLHRLELDAVQNLEDEGTKSALLPVRDLERLIRLPEVTRGWVADEVTPLILRAAFAPDSLGAPREIRWRIVDVEDGGMEPPLEDRLDEVDGPCGTASGGVQRVGRDCPNAIAILPALDPSSLRFRPGSSEIRFTVVVEDVLSRLPLARRTVSLRQPPVLLVHDFNSAGDWGVGFREGLATEGRPFNPTDPRDNFIRTVRYGQESFFEMESLDSAFLPQASVGLLHRQNTFLPFDRLFPLLEAALEEEMDGLREDWAITRPDMVGHGQGGLLVRMLATKPPLFSTRFRRHGDFYRGRFRLAVTLGAPHNGIRLFGYLRKLDRNRDFVRDLPESIVSLGLFSNAVQAKFDPFGKAIRSLNSYLLSTTWHPDFSARIHRIAGRWTDNTVLAGFLGLAGEGTEQRRAAVFPLGSDGWVDLASAVGHYASIKGPFISLGNFAHRGPPGLFINRGALQDPVPVQNQDHTAGALVSSILASEDPTNPTKAFGSFAGPSPLGVEDEEAVALAASEAWDEEWATREARIIAEDSRALASLRDRQISGAATAEATLYRYHLEAANRDTTGEVYWFAEVFGPGGVTSASLTVTPIDGDPGHVEVTVPNSVVGDVVLYVSYQLAGGRTAFGQSVRVIERDPPGIQISGLAVIPRSGEYPVAEFIRPRLLVAYSDGTVLQRHVDANNLAATSSMPNVVDVSDPLAWHLASPGQATVTLTYRGHSTTNTLTVRANPPGPTGLRIVDWSLEGARFTITVLPGDDATPLTLWRATSLADPVWAEVDDAVVLPFDDGTVTVADPHPAEGQSFYQVTAGAGAP
jgi:hypothetical protein